MADTNFFQSCSQQYPNGTTTDVLECVSNSIETHNANSATEIQSFLYVISGAMIFFMQAGFAVLCAGAVRVKNVQNTMLKNLLDACGAAIAFFMFGYAFAFGGQYDTDKTTFIGTKDFFQTGDNPAYWFFQYTFSATSVTIVAGTLAERCQMAAYLCYSIVLAGFIYPVIAHSVWSNNGFLSNSNVDPILGSGAIDFAGSGVVHMTGGTVALFATLILGPRRGRFFDAQGEPLETPKAFPGHSMALQLLGTMILWFGWFGFNGGSALSLDNENIGKVAANAAVSTALSGAAGGITALFTNLWIEERKTGEPNFSLVSAMNGSLSGLVAITGSCGIVEPWAAVLTGIIAGWLYLYGSSLLIRLKIDDAVDAIPVHQVNGAWGVIATGFLASPRQLELAYGHSDNPGWFYSLGSGSFNARLLGSQIVMLLFILGWTMVTMLPFFVWLNYKGWLRADSLEELVGLDISYHGGMNSSRDGSVKKEYIEAYNKHKGTVRKRRSRGGGLNGGGGGGGIDGLPTTSTGGLGDTSLSGYGEDPETNQEAAALEAFEEH